MYNIGQVIKATSIEVKFTMMSLKRMTSYSRCQIIHSCAPRWSCMNEFGIRIFSPIWHGIRTCLIDAKVRQVLLSLFVFFLFFFFFSFKLVLPLDLKRQSRRIVQPWFKVLLLLLLLLDSHSKYRCQTSQVKHVNGPKIAVIQAFFFFCLFDSNPAHLKPLKWAWRKSRSNGQGVELYLVAKALNG